MRKEIKITLTDNNTPKDFVITQMSCTGVDSFVNLAVKMLVKDDVKYPDGLLSGGIRQTIYNLMQSGKVDESGSTPVVDIMNNLLPILKSAYANLTEDERVLLLDKLLSTVVYQNGIIKNQLNYAACDDYIESVTTIYKLAWEVLRANFSLLSAENTSNTPAGQQPK